MLLVVNELNTGDISNLGHGNHHYKYRMNEINFYCPRLEILLKYAVSTVLPFNSPILTSLANVLGFFANFAYFVSPPCFCVCR